MLISSDPSHFANKKERIKKPFADKKPFCQIKKPFAMPHLLAEARPCCFTATNATSCQTLVGQGAQKIVRETKNCQGVKRSKKIRNKESI